MITTPEPVAIAAPADADPMPAHPLNIDYEALMDQPLEAVGYDGMDD